MKKVEFLQRTLELTVRVGDETCEVDVYEPESGEVSSFQFSFSPDEHPDFNEAIGNEIYSWMSLWKDEYEDEKSEEDEE